jgi:hypothetical protein
VTAVGAGVGLAMGALIPRMTTVYRSQERLLSVSPDIIRGGIALRASLRW